MFSKFIFILIIITLDLSKAVPIVSRSPKEQSDSNENNLETTTNRISSETVRIVSNGNRSIRSTRADIKSKILETLNNDQIFEYETDCKLKTIFLKVDELGWKNKVLAPSGFSFNYCDGNCKPVEFTPLTLIVRDKGRIKLKIYENLLVTKCG